MDRLCKILSVWFGPNHQVDKNWSEVLEKVIPVVNLWLQSNLSLKGRVEVHVTYICHHILYCFLVLPLHHAPLKMIISSGAAKLPWCVMKSVAFIPPIVIWNDRHRHFKILYDYISCTGCVHRMMGMAPSRRRMSKQLFHL